MKLNKRSWIPLIGWILCYGFLHNCVIAPYFAVDVIDWEQLLTSLGIMLGISGVRDIGINRRKKMMEILKKFRAIVFTAIALFLYLFGYRHAKEAAENKQTKGKLNAVKAAKNVRSGLSDIDRIKRLHDKYKR